MHSPVSFDEVEDNAHQSELRPGLRGWLLVYLVGLVLEALHGLGLTVGAIVVYSDPGLAGLTSFVPFGGLLFYVVTNVALAAYTALVLALMIRRRKTAIIHNIGLNCLSVLFLTLWHVLGEKSPVGTVLDSLPGLVGLAYILRSRRVRATFTLPGHTPWRAHSS